MARLKNTNIAGTSNITAQRAGLIERPVERTVIDAFTIVGTTSWTAPADVKEIEVLVVGGGGGGGGSTYSGGGGAGGLIYRSEFSVTSGTSYTVTVGGGGAIGLNGSNSVFSTLTAIGGGAGGTGSLAGSAGGSGGGGGGSDTDGDLPSRLGGTPTDNQGFRGGAGAGGSGVSTNGAGGGGGAGGAGGDRQRNVLTGTCIGYCGTGGSGGPGLNFPQFKSYGESGWFAGGGGGSGHANAITSISNAAIGLEGIGGGAGANRASALSNTGGGGRYDTAGGSGVVLIKYNTLSDSNRLIEGSFRFNETINSIEIYEGSQNKWASDNPDINYAGHNLYQYSQDMSNGVWQKGNTTVSTNTTIAPDGTLTADSVFETSANDYHRILTASPGNVLTAIGNKVYTFSVYVKRLGGERHIYFMSQASSNAIYAHYDMTSNTLSSSGQSGTGKLDSASITPIGDGWYRLSITGAVVSTTSTVFNQIYFSNIVGSGFVAVGPYVGSTLAGFSVWNWQCEESSFAGPPVRTVDTISPAPTITADGYRIHSFTQIGSASFVPALSGDVEVLVVGGGGGGGANHAGGGGGGGLIYKQKYPVNSNQVYNVTVGNGGSAGGPTGTGPGTPGGNSVFGTLAAIGGGAGGNRHDVANAESSGQNGGSGGGGGGAQSIAPLCWLSGQNTIDQGHPGGRAIDLYGGGGGGAGAPGNAGGPWAGSGNGGDGLPFSISGTMRYYSGGGGGSSGGITYIGKGGKGGGGTAGTITGSNGTPGQANTGGGGGGGGAGNTAGSAGGSGIVIIRYKYK